MCVYIYIYIYTQTPLTEVLLLRGGDAERALRAGVQPM